MQSPHQMLNKNLNNENFSRLKALEILMVTSMLITDVGPTLLETKRVGDNFKMLVAVISVTNIHYSFA